MRTLAGLIVMASLALACGARAEDATAPAVAPIESRYDCRRDEAIVVAFLDLAKNIETYAGKCVIVQGMTSGDFFYGGIEDYYRANNANIPRVHRSVGIYAANDDMREQLFGWRQSVEIIAFANTCKHLAAQRDLETERWNKEAERRGDEVRRISMAGGFCHYTLDSPVLHVSELRVLDNGPIRLVGEDAYRSFGDIDDLKPNSPIYAEVSTRLTNWFDAVRRRDAVAVFKQTSHNWGVDLGDKDEWPNSIFWDPKTPLRFLLGQPSLPPIRYYVRRLPAEEAQRGYQAYGCICRTSACRGKWPIHSADAGVVPEWPYVCMWTEKAGAEVTVGQ